MVLEKKPQVLMSGFNFFHDVPMKLNESTDGPWGGHLQIDSLTFSYRHIGLNNFQFKPI